jgi:hypothetical protein
MPAYDAERFSPPAPLASVACKNPETGGTWTDMPMLIDTGADVSLLPRAALTASISPSSRTVATS